MYKVSPVTGLVLTAAAEPQSCVPHPVLGKSVSKMVLLLFIYTIHILRYQDV